MNKFLFLLFGCLILFTSCNDEEENTSFEYTKGTFIVNEGAFNGGTGTISYYNGQNTTQNVFEKENGGNVLGNIAQSMIKFGDKYFIAVNNAAKIEVVNARDFKSIGVIKNLVLPRYFATTQNRLFITSWGNDFVSGFINELDPNDLTVTSSTPVNGLVERIIAKDNFLFVTISSDPFSALQRNILVMDINTKTIVDTIIVGENPSDLTFDKNGDIWVTCSGFTDFNDPAKSTAGSMHKVSGRKSVLSYPLSNGAKGIAIDKKGENIYYISNGKALEHNILSQGSVDKTVIEGSFYAIAYSKLSDELYIGEKEYQKPGKVDVINSITLTKKSFEAGIIPTFFYFSE